MADQPQHTSPDQTDDQSALRQPGSQSGSGMDPDRNTDALLSALQREQQATSAAAVPATDAAAGSPIGRSPEATAGPVTD